MLAWCVAPSPAEATAPDEFQATTTQLNLYENMKYFAGAGFAAYFVGHAPREFHGGYVLGQQ